MKKYLNIINQKVLLSVNNFVNVTTVYIIFLICTFEYFSEAYSIKYDVCTHK